MDIGVDIIEIDRIERMLRTYAAFRARVFTEREIEYCEHKKYPAQHYAARFAAKESILKSLGPERGDLVGWKDLEIVDRSSGKPQVQLHGQASALAEKRGIKEVKVSLSHGKAYAVATALAIPA
jgi:holo-[acyl-carrier protein] synthase